MKARRSTLLHSVVSSPVRSVGGTDLVCRSSIWCGVKRPSYLAPSEDVPVLQTPLQGSLGLNIIRRLLKSVKPKEAETVLMMACSNQLARC
jgi:hypothetical protein